jgi:RNA polymerase sigma-70 factor (ECF subfamily)
MTDNDNLAYKMTRDAEEAKDLAQDVFVKAYRGLNQFKAESSFWTWLYQIALNSIINYTRKKRWRTLVSIFEVKEPVAVWGNPEEIVRKEQINQAIDQAILSLPARQRSVFVLRQYQELPYQEIARMTGKTEGALKASYFQAVRKLQRKLAHLR